jgi:hypothetical protein
LEFQLNNLKAYINNPSAEKLEMPGQQRAEKIHSDMEMMDHGISVPTTADVYSATPEAQHTASVSVDTILSFVLSGNMDKALEDLSTLHLCPFYSSPGYHLF